MKKKNIIIAVAVIIFLILLGIYVLTETNSISDATKFKNEYEELNGVVREKDGKTIRTISIPSENPIIYRTPEEIIKMMDNKDTFLVYFGFSDCPWCRSVIPTLIECANDLALDKIYYVDVEEIRDEIEINENGELETTTTGSDGYYNLIERLSNVLEDYIITDNDGNNIQTGEKRIYAPSIVAITDGEAIQITDGISESQTDGYMELTDEMIDDTYQEFKCIIQCVKEAKQTCDINKQC